MSHSRDDRKKPNQNSPLFKSSTAGYGTIFNDMEESTPTKFKLTQTAASKPQNSDTTATEAKASTSDTQKQGYHNSTTRESTETTEDTTISHDDTSHTKKCVIS